MVPLPSAIHVTFAVDLRAYLRTHPAPLMGELDPEAPCDTGPENY